MQHKNGTYKCVLLLLLKNSGIVMWVLSCYGAFMASGVYLFDLQIQCFCPRWSLCGLEGGQYVPQIVGIHLQVLMASQPSRFRSQ
jgi:hypothetical protein